MTDATLVDRFQASILGLAIGDALGRPTEFRVTMEGIRRHFGPDDVLCMGELGEAWIAEEAVASALYCFCKSPGDYAATVLTGANTVGDSDSIACIAGAISGAYLGLTALPENWRRQVENADMLSEIGMDLHAAMLQRTAAA